MSPEPRSWRRPTACLRTRTGCRWRPDFVPEASRVTTSCVSLARRRTRTYQLRYAACGLILPERPYVPLDIRARRLCPDACWLGPFRRTWDRFGGSLAAEVRTALLWKIRRFLPAALCGRVLPPDGAAAVPRSPLVCCNITLAATCGPSVHRQAQRRWHSLPLKPHGCSGRPQLAGAPT